jgi:hypothetical protein
MRTINVLSLEQALTTAFIACVVLRAVFHLSVVCYFVRCVVCCVLLAYHCCRVKKHLQFK